MITKNRIIQELLILKFNLKAQIERMENLNKQITQNIELIKKWRSETSENNEKN